MENKKTYIAIGILAVLTAVAGYGYKNYKQTISNIRKESASLSEKLASTQADLQKTQDSLATLEKKASLLGNVLLDEQARNISTESQVNQVSTTVGVLDKLSKTDRELLKQYSKVYFLNEHYVPESLALIDPKYIYTQGKTLQIHTSVAPYLSTLLDAAKTAGLGLKLDSAYRSFGTQATLKASYKVIYGAGTANSFSAEQGYSEHQLGTTVDFTTDSLKGELSGFNATPEYAWLLQNAYQFGFIISYPQNNTSYQFEPWHWRFVGKDLALYLHQNNMYFYNMDQRKIDTYLANIFD